MWQPPTPPPLDIRSPSSKTPGALTEQEKQRKYQQHLKEVEDYLDRSQRSQSSSVLGVLPLPNNDLPVTHSEHHLTLEEKEARYQQHLAEYSSLPVSGADSNNTDLNGAESYQQYFAAYPGVSPNPSHAQAYLASPQSLLPMPDNRSPVNSSYSSMIPALHVPGYQHAPERHDELTAEELAQIRAAEAASLASMPKPVERKLTGRDICDNSIQPEQQKDFENLKKLWAGASDKNLSLMKKFLAVLNYYTYGDSIFKPIANLGRKNLTEIEPIIKHLEEVEKANIPMGDEDLSQQVLGSLYKIPLNNPKGALATVIQFLTQQTKVTQENKNLYRRP